MGERGNSKPGQVLKKRLHTHISGQDTIHIAFFNMMGSPLSPAKRLKAQSPKLMWTELKRELSMQYSAIPYDSHVTQAFAQLEQDPDELLDIYFHHAIELLSETYHTSDMSKIFADGLNHYKVVYGLNCRRLKDSVVGQQSKQSKKMKGCFRDIHNIVAGYEKFKGYCRAEYNFPEASAITEVKTMRKLGVKEQFVQ